ncbi:hypothetical protein LTR84_011250 [Exophiala bonariae]|uniref:Uncharacterized protein n=1 Tax=Exophiala bonariae TaxID=1690606 RepID=A0AAV9MTY9_9EURO|nr:hypothetical protein LTR84_011250 [Exophiala bonariae]
MVGNIANLPEYRAKLLLMQAAIQLGADAFADITMASALCLAVYEMLKLREPNMSHGDLVLASEVYLKNVDDPYPPTGWENELTEFQGRHFFVNETKSTASYAGQRIVAPEEWSRQILKVKALIESQFAQTPDPATEE